MFPVQRIRVALLLAICAVAVPACVPAQTGNGGTGLVTGRVLCDDGSPARFARVYLYELDPATGLFHGRGTSGDATTDLNGNYLIASMASGTYFVRINLRGYVDDSYLIFALRDKLPPDMQKSLLATFPQVIVKNGSTSRLNVTVQRGGAISGRVSFDSGGALEGEEVKATLISSRFLDDLTQGSSGLYKDSNTQLDLSQALTDDRGVYRLSGLPQGKYRISVRLTYQGQYYGSEDGRHAADITVYPPDALNPSEATLTDVDVGDEITGIDIVIPTGKLHTVGGFVTQEGTPLEDARVELLAQSEAATTPSQRPRWQILTRADGSFQFEMIPSGTYTLRARYVAAGTHTLAATRQISVTVTDSDVLDANVDLSPAKP